MPVAPIGISEADRCASVGIDKINILVTISASGEGNLFTVRRPGRGRIALIGISKFSLRRAIRVHEIYLRMAIAAGDEGNLAPSPSAAGSEQKR